MHRTLETAISDEDDLILHRASDLLDALPWQRVRNLHTPRCELMVGHPELIVKRMCWHSPACRCYKFLGPVCPPLQHS